MDFLPDDPLIPQQPKSSMPKDGQQPPQSELQPRGLAPGQLEATGPLDVTAPASEEADRIPAPAWWNDQAENTPDESELTSERSPVRGASVSDRGAEAQTAPASNDAQQATAPMPGANMDLPVENGADDAVMALLAVNEPDFDAQAAPRPNEHQQPEQLRHDQSNADPRSPAFEITPAVEMDTISPAALAEEFPALQGNTTPAATNFHDLLQRLSADRDFAADADPWTPDRGRTREEPSASVTRADNADTQTESAAGISPVLEVHWQQYETMVETIVERAAERLSTLVHQQIEAALNEREFREAAHWRTVGGS